MSAIWRPTGLLALFVLSGAAPVCAQQIRREFGIQGYALISDGDRLGGGVFGALRVGPRARLSLFAGADQRSGGSAGRVEGLAHLLLSPRRRQGAGFYCAGGVAVDLATTTEARMVGLIGVEGRPGARSGWVAEVGAGGGWRLTAGWRWRR